jgi:hypothetical protein
MTFFQKLFLVRFSLIAAAILFFLPIIVVNLGIGKQLFGGLFDLPAAREMFWAVFFAYMLSFSAVVTFRITVMYGPERCGFLKSKRGGFIESRTASFILFVLSLLLPLPLILNTVRQDLLRPQLIGGFLGFLAAMLMVFTVDIFQRLFTTFRSESETKAAKTLFVPFSYPLSSIAEKSNFITRFVQDIGFVKRIERFLFELDPKYGVGFIDRDIKPVALHPGIVLATVMLGGFLLIYLTGFYIWTKPLTDGRLSPDFGITTITYVYVLMTLLCWLFAGIAFVFDRFRFPTILVIVLILAVSKIDHSFDVWLAESPGNLTTAAGVVSARKNDRYLVFVAANGGGIQASAWTAEVLTRFVEDCRRIDPSANGCENAIALISGVSGGSVGTMYFVDGRYGVQDLSDADERIRASARKSSLSFVAGGLVFNDFPRNIPGVTRGSESDRGKQLARGWIENKKRVDCEYLLKHDRVCDEAALSTQLSGRLSEWGRDLTGETRRPAVIFNSTLVETGQRLLFTTTRFITPYTDGADRMTFRDFAGENADIDVVEAVRLSASFPYVTPAANMREGKGVQGHHVVDGGYFDNYGLMSVRDFLDESFEGVRFDRERPPKIVIIQIYGDEVLRPPEKEGERVKRFDNLEWLTQVFAPLGTLLSVRQTGQYTRNQEACRAIEEIVGRNDLELYHFVFKYSKGANEMAPLSWHLTSDDIKAIEKASFEMLDPTATNPNANNWQRLMKLIRRATGPTENLPGVEIVRGCL